MRRHPCLVLIALLGVVGLLFGLAEPVRSQRPTEETLAQRVARTAKVSEANVNRVLEALGPAIREELRQGKQVELSGLGVFRVVRIAEHRDLRNGRPVIIPAVNRVEFLASGDLTDAANTAGAQPAETVPGFQYIVLPGQTPSQLTPKVRVPPLRTR